MIHEQDFENWAGFYETGMLPEPRLYKPVFLFGANPEVEEVIRAQGAGPGLRIYDDSFHPAIIKGGRAGCWDQGFEDVINCAGFSWIICGVASTPTARAKAVEKIIEGLGPNTNWCWKTVVATSAHVGEGAEIGPGSLVLDMAYVGPMAKIKHQVALLPGAKVYHNAVVGSFSIIVGGSTVLGRSQIGRATHVCANAVVLPEGFISGGSTIGAGLTAKKLVAGGD